MKRFAIGCLAILSAIPSAAMGDPKEEIVVAPDPAVGHWVAVISDRIDASLRYPYTFREPAPSGGVSVTFRCSDDGSPDAVQVVHPSGSARLDSAAVSAIERIKTLHPLPASLARDQLFRANIVFAVDERELAREEAALRMATRQPASVLAANDKAPLEIAVRRLK